MTSRGLFLSIVICSRDGEQRLPKLFASLLQLPAEPDWEAILVDNASTDGTRQIILEQAKSDPRIRYVHCPTIGLGAARNAGWREANAELVAFTDDDCSLASDYVARMVEVFDEHSEAGFVGGRVVMEERPDAAIINERTSPRAFAPFSTISAGDISGANHAFRKAVLEKTGGFDPAFGTGTAFPCEDVDAAAAALWAGVPGRFDPRPTVFHHGGCDDERRLAGDYAKGRGAYSMKYILRRDSRWPYLKLWLAASLRNPDPVRTTRELAAGLRYLWRQRGRA